MHALSANTRGGLLTLLGIGALVFAACLVLQYSLYRLLLAPKLKSPDMGVRRSGVMRWFAIEVGLQAVMLVAVVAYMLTLARSHPGAFEWLAPAAGALLGCALPLQLAVAGIARAAR